MQLSTSRAAGRPGHTDGADIPAALGHLANAGYSVTRLASDLAVNRATVYRWRASRHQPSPANFEALREWVEQTYAVKAHRRTLTTKALHLQQAHEALLTTAERAEEEALAQRLAEVWAERDRREAAEQAARDARARQIRDEVLGRRVSITAAVDPFDLIHGGRVEPALPF